ncbi:hypothetical protein ABZP36_002702 [Zizania latifolia]
MVQRRLEQRCRTSSARVWSGIGRGAMPARAWGGIGRRLALRRSVGPPRSASSSARFVQSANEQLRSSPHTPDPEASSKTVAALSLSPRASSSRLSSRGQPGEEAPPAAELVASPAKSFFGAPLAATMLVHTPALASPL